jgi:hypothetical protein
MRVREYHRTDCFWIKRKVTVVQRLRLPFPLDNTAIHKEPRVCAAVEELGTRPCDVTVDRAVESDFHKMAFRCQHMRVPINPRS